MTDTIEIKLFALLRKYSPDSSERYPIPPGFTVRQLIRNLGIPEEKVRLTFVDGVRADPDTRLYGGQRVGIFPPVGGG